MTVPQQPASPRQLTMSFDGTNTLAERLRRAEFILVLEQNTPRADQPFDSAIALAAAVGRKAKSLPEIAALALTDRLLCEDAHDPVDAAVALSTVSERPAMVHISGKGTDTTRVKDLAARARSQDTRTLLAVTGDRSDHHESSGKGGRMPPYAKGYMDGIDVMRTVRSNGAEFCVGCAVNPYKYVPEDVYLQYYKMVRKINSGADFLVTHAGWDMRKLQELQWYLQMRELGNAVLARIQLLAVEDVAHIHEGLYPGVHIAREFAAALQRESNISENQCLAAQLNRIGLQVAGCRLLGYSGAQLAGIRDPRTLEMVVAKIREALDEYHDYPTWLAAWNQYHAGLAFAPFPDAFYMFDGLMQPEQQHFDPDACAMKGCLFQQPGWADRARSACVSWSLEPGRPHAIRRLAMACSGTENAAEAERRAYCYHLNPADCPKGLVYGACGGSRGDGTCEFGHRPCFFHRVAAIAQARHEPDLLEEGISA